MDLIRYSACLFFILFSLVAKGQLAVINDPDGFVNVRDGKSSSAKVISRLKTNEVVLFDGEAVGNEWINVFYSPENTVTFSADGKAKWYTRKEAYLNGYVHKSRVTPIDDLKKAVLRKATGYIISKETGEQDTIVCLIKIRAFNATTHKITKSNSGCINCAKFVDKIDGKKPWGVDGELPKKEINSFILTINNQTITIPKDSYSDIYQLSPENLSIHYDKAGVLYLYCPGNSDGAGGYDVIWVIYKGTLIKRYVDSIG